MAGYFVCGFQVVFIGVHMPSYLKDQGLTPDVATTALALIGLFNVFGTYAAGIARPAPAEALHPVGDLRCCARSRSSLFLLAPLTPWSVYVFAAAMGLLWLSTVPPTNAVVAQIFGVQLPVDARRLRLPEPPGRQLPRRLARRPALRRDRQLRRRLVDRGRARRVRRARQPAGARARDRAPGAGCRHEARRRLRSRWAAGAAALALARCSRPTCSPTWRSTWPTRSGPASDAPARRPLRRPSPWVSAGRT